MIGYLILCYRFLKISKRKLRPPIGNEVGQALGQLRHLGGAGGAVAPPMVKEKK